jgi:hypothetical protein
MLSDRLIAALAPIARLDSERALLQGLRRACARVALEEPGRAREEADRACARAHAEAIRAEPWPIPEEMLFELARLAGPLSWTAAMAALLRGGAGASALSPAHAGGCWAPTWLAREAARRTASPPPPLPERWALPSGYPIPLRQSFMSPALARGALGAAASPWLGAAALELAAPLPPAAWLSPRPGLPEREELLRLARADPPAAMRALLGLGRSPLDGWMREVARILLAATLGAGLAGARARGIDAALAGGRVALAPGWMLAAAQALGWTLRGAPAAASAPCEEALLTHAGGAAVLDAHGRVARHVLPAAASAWLRALPLPWSELPREPASGA